MKKLTSVEVLKSGEGKKGPWNLTKIGVEGSELTYTGFFYREVPKEGDEIDIEFFQEEYNGKMQDKFRLAGVNTKKAQPNVNEMAIKMAIAQATSEVTRKLDLLLEHFEIKDVVAKMKEVDEIEPKDIPF